MSWTLTAIQLLSRMENPYTTSSAQGLGRFPIAENWPALLEQPSLVLTMESYLVSVCRTSSTLGPNVLVPFARAVLSRVPVCLGNLDCQTEQLPSKDTSVFNQRTDEHSLLYGPDVITIGHLKKSNSFSTTYEIAFTCLKSSQGRTCTHGRLPRVSAWVARKRKF